jgi:hypothetical protein
MCLERRIEQRSKLKSEVATWEHRCNASRENNHRAEVVAQNAPIGVEIQPVSCENASVLYASV